MDAGEALLSHRPTKVCAYAGQHRASRTSATGVYGRYPAGLKGEQHAQHPSAGFRASPFPAFATDGPFNTHSVLRQRLREPNDLLGPRRHSDTRAFEVVINRLIHTTEMLREERLRDREEGDAILGAGMGTPASRMARPSTTRRAASAPTASSWSSSRRRPESSSTCSAISSMARASPSSGKT